MVSIRVSSFVVRGPLELTSLALQQTCQSIDRIWGFRATSSFNSFFKSFYAFTAFKSFYAFSAFIVEGIVGIARIGTSSNSS